MELITSGILMVWCIFLDAPQSWVIIFACLGNKRSTDKHIILYQFLRDSTQKNTVTRTFSILLELIRYKDKGLEVKVFYLPILDALLESYNH